MQSCESDEDTEAQDTASRCIDAIFELTRICGEVAVTTETVTTALKDPELDSLAELISMAPQKEEDVLAAKVGARFATT